MAADLGQIDIPFAQAEQEDPGDGGTLLLRAKRRRRGAPGRAPALLQADRSTHERLIALTTPFDLRRWSRRA